MKKEKILKVVLIIVILLLIIFTIHVVRNYIIISKIIEKQEELEQTNNYSYITEETYNEGKNVIERYSTENNNLWISKKENNMIWYNKEKGTIYSIITNEKFVVIEEFSEDSLIDNAKQILSQDRIKTFKEKMIVSMKYFITNEKIGEVKCYVLKNENAKYYIDAKEGNMLKTTIGDDCVIEYKDWKINNVKDEEVLSHIPDLTGYTMYDKNFKKIYEE